MDDGHNNRDMAGGPTGTPNQVYLSLHCVTFNRSRSLGHCRSSQTTYSSYIDTASTNWSCWNYLMVHFARLWIKTLDKIQLCASFMFTLTEQIKKHESTFKHYIFCNLKSFKDCSNSKIYIGSHSFILHNFHRGFDPSPSVLLAGKYYFRAVLVILFT